jgi:hypothetical protein
MTQINLVPWVARRRAYLRGETRRAPSTQGAPQVALATGAYMGAGQTEKRIHGRF